MKYRKKPVVIEAVKFENSQRSIREVLEFIGQKVDTNSNIATQRFEEYCRMVVAEGMIISTLEGGHIASIGDMIIKGVQGEFYPCKPDIFEQTYEEVKG